MRLPSKCSHAYGMIFEDDFCACKICEQSWTLDPQKGWIPLIDGELFKPQWRPQKKKRH